MNLRHTPRYPIHVAMENRHSVLKWRCGIDPRLYTGIHNSAETRSISVLSNMLVSTIMREIKL